MEIHRFGPGHRRPDGPPGTQGVSGGVIWSDERADISELAFARRALVPPHVNPNTTLFIVVSGGGWVQVGDERAAVNQGEAVVWPARVEHGAWTDGSEMRALVVELSEREPAPRGDRVPEGLAVAAPEGALPAASPARGVLSGPTARREDHDESEGEPW